MTSIFIDAGLTDFARQLQSRACAEGVMLGDWSFQVGTDGYDLGTPTLALDVDPSLQVLGAPVGGSRLLGRALASGAAAAVSVVGQGILEVSGLAAIPSMVHRRWLSLSGSADPLLNGTWLITSWISANTVRIYNPLASAGDAGPLAWTLRSSVALSPNPRATAFHGKLDTTDVTDGLILGEIGIFGRVLRAPSDPGIVGNAFLFATTHHAAIVKTPGVFLTYFICVQA
jgi:hypothetical protein